MLVCTDRISALGTLGVISLVATDFSLVCLSLRKKGTKNGALGDTYAVGRVI